MGQSMARAKKLRRKQEERARAAREQRFQERLATREARLHSKGEPLLRFFTPLGMSVDLVVDPERDRYVVGQHVIGEDVGGWQHVEPASEDSEIDKFVLRHLARRFAESVTANAAPLWPGARAYYVKSDHGFVLAWPDAEVGFVVITPTHGRVFHGGPTLDGNYLLPGAHWKKLKRAIDEHEEARRVAPVDVPTQGRATSRQPIRVPIRILSKVPEDVPRATARFLIDASRRLRLERQMVYGAPVILEANFGLIRFDPLEGPASELVVPFELACRDGVVEGGIALNADDDPLRVELYRDELGDDMFIWSTALSGYADVTTWDVLSAAEGRRARRRNRGVNPRGGANRALIHRSGAANDSRLRLPRARRENENEWPSY
jgi:hypothetical protein